MSKYRVTSAGNYWFYAAVAPSLYVIATVFVFFICKPLDQTARYALTSVLGVMALAAIMTNGRFKRIVVSSDGFIVIQGFLREAKVPMGHLVSIDGKWTRAGYILKLYFSPATPFGPWVKTTPPKHEAAEIIGRLRVQIAEVARAKNQTSADETI